MGKILVFCIVSTLILGLALPQAPEHLILSKLGYTSELVEDILNQRTVFSQDNEAVGRITEALPVQADRALRSFSVLADQENEIRIEYAFDYHNSYQGGNGLDPFPESVRENNALLLFAAIEGLDKVSFLHYNDSTLSHTNSYTADVITDRFGGIIPFELGVKELYGKLAANIQLSEFYFAHYSRIYLGKETWWVEYREGKPDEIISLPDGTSVWVYNELGSRSLSAYYFDSPAAAQNDDLTGLYATGFAVTNGETYDDLVSYLGKPDIFKTIGDGYTYIAYPLREGQQRNAYFILHNNKVFIEGVMYGDDYGGMLCVKLP